jgi:hypothetical protein
MVVRHEVHYTAAAARDTCETRREPLSLSIGNAVLRRALARSLGDAFSITDEVAQEELSGLLVLTTPADLPPVDCDGLAREGAIIVIIAALPRDDEAQAYLDRGAVRYLEMGLPPDELVAQLREVYQQCCAREQG